MISIISERVESRETNIVNNSNSYDLNEIEIDNVNENGRCEDRLPNTLTHSLTLSQTPSLIANDNTFLL